VDFIAPFYVKSVPSIENAFYSNKKFLFYGIPGELACHDNVCFATATG
jgi:hypothetical protein